MHCIYGWAHGQGIYLCTIFMSGPMMRIFIYVLLLPVGPSSEYFSMYCIYKWAHDENYLSMYCIYESAHDVNIFHSLVVTFTSGPKLTVFISFLYLWMGP